MSDLDVVSSVSSTTMMNTLTRQHRHRLCLDICKRTRRCLFLLPEDPLVRFRVSFVSILRHPNADVRVQLGAELVVVHPTFRGAAVHAEGREDPLDLRRAETNVELLQALMERLRVDRARVVRVACVERGNQDIRPL